MRKFLPFFCGCLLTACAPAPRPSAESPLPPEVSRRWQTDHSYYALIEIVDAHFADRPDGHRATRQDLHRYLGPPNWGTVIQDPNAQWAYQGFGRHVPYGNKVIFTFNDRDEIINIDWLSE